MKTIKLIIITAILIITNSCSTSSSDSSCSQIVCGTPGSPINGKYYIYKGTIETCGETELEVNQATFNYYQAKWQASPEGYCCWEGMK